MSESSENGLSITNTCHACMLLDSKCPECQELWDASQSDLAHEIVDQGNMQYRRQWLRPIEYISGHEWTSREDELKPPTVFLVDCMSENLAIGLGEDLEMGAREIACACGMVQMRGHSNCFYCEKELV